MSTFNKGEVLTAAALNALADSIPAATAAVPLIDGVAALGTDAGWARGDHVHPASPGAPTYIFIQAIPAAAWTINHGLGEFPSVAVIDSTGAQVEGDVSYVSGDQIVLSFTGAFSGTAYLN
jgi:hypothetical protein